MSFNRIGAMGVQQGLISPEEEFLAQRTDAARRAQMALLSGAGGGGSFAGVGPGGAAATGGDPQQSEWREDQVFNRNLRGALEMQKQGGMNALDLSKQGGANDQTVATTHMAPALMREQTNRQAYDDSSGLRNLQQKRGMQTLQGIMNGTASSSDDPNMTMMREAIAMGQSPAPFLEAQSRDKQYSHQVDQSREAGMQQLIAAIAQQNPEMAAQLAGTTQTFGGLPEGSLAGAFTAGGQKQYEQLAPSMAPDIDRMRKTIRANNWSIGENQDQLRSLYNSILAKAQSFKPAPQAFRALQEDLKNAMRDALQENGLFFESSGSDTTRQNFGL